MLDQNDLQQIKGIVKKTIDESLENFAATYIKPSFDDVSLRLDKVEGRLGRVENRLDGVKRSARLLPDKDYLDRKLFELKGELNENTQKVEKKADYHTHVLKENDLLDENDLKELRKFNTFRVIPEPAVI